MGNIIKDGSGSYFPMLFILPLAGLAELASLYSIQALLPKLSEVYHIPLNQVGMILSAEVGFLAFAMLFSGSLSDRFGRKPVIFASLCRRCFDVTVRAGTIMAGFSYLPGTAGYCGQRCYCSNYGIYQ